MAEEIIEVGGATIKYGRGLAGSRKRKRIPCEEIWDLLTKSERQAVAGSGTQKAKAFLWTLAISTDIKRAQIDNIVMDLEEAGLIAAGRTQEIVDAIP